MTTTDWIQFWLAIGTGILAIISTISIVIVLRQNHKIIETSKRPFILIYKDIISNTSPIEYLVIKNSGNTTAHITSIEYNDQDIKKLNKSFSMVEDALIGLSNSYIAPNQNYKIPIKSLDTDIEVLDFKITYSNGIKSYCENFKINLKQDYSIASLKQHTSSSKQNHDLKDISETLQELVKKIS